MNGISCLMSKSLSPTYNLGTANKIKLIPSRLSNLHLQNPSPLLTTTRLLKNRVYSSSASKDVTGSRSQVPEVSGTSVPYSLLGLGVVGFMNPNARYYIILGVVAVLVATGFLGKIIDGLEVVSEKYFSNGDIIEVEDLSGIQVLSGQVIKTGVITTSFLTSDNRRIHVPTLWFKGKIIENRSRGFLIIPNSYMLSVDSIVDESQAPNSVVSRVYVRIDMIEKIHEIAEDIMKMMKSNPNVLLEKELPYCYRSNVDEYHVWLRLGCNLKPMSEEESYSVKRDIHNQSFQIIKKYRAT